MSVSALAVRRPVATTALVLLLILLGVVSLTRLEVTLFPDLAEREVDVWIGWPEAGVEEIEEEIARPVEAMLVGVSGAERVFSEIVPGGAFVTLRLRAGTDAEIAALAVRERLDALRWELPAGAERPALAPGVSGRPVMVLALGAEDRSLAAEWAEAVLRPRLEQLEGVARVQVVGAPETEVTVIPDRARLRTFGVDAQDLEAAIASAAARSPGGRLSRRGIHYAVEMEGGVASAAEVARVVVRSGGRPLRVADLAEVREGVSPEFGVSRLDGQPALGALLYRAEGANLLETADRVRGELARLAEEEDGVDVLVLQDPAPFVSQAVTGVWQAVLVGGVLASAVLALFLRDVRSAVIIAVAVPASVLAGFVCFDLLGVSLNLMSLGGLALGVGMLVDNGIVCLENIDRLRLLGVDPRTAAGRGAAEIAGPIASSTLTTCAVFLPMATIPGPIGGLLRDQAIAITVSLLISLGLALTLVPTLAARLGSRPPRGVHGGRPWLPGYTFYHRLFLATLRHPGPALALGFLLVATSVFGLLSRPREILPELRTDQVEIELELPAGHDVTSTDAAARVVEAWLRARPEVEHVFSAVGAAGELALSPQRRLHRATFHVRMSPDGDRHALTLALGQAFTEHPEWTLGVRAARAELESILPSGEPKLVCEVSATDPKEVGRAAAALAAALAREPGGERFRHELGMTIPRLEVEARRAALARLQIGEADVRSALLAQAGGQELALARRFDRNVPVVLRSGEREFPGVGALELNGRAIAAREVVQAGIGLGASRLLRVDQARVERIVWDGPLREVGEAQALLERVAADVDLPAGARWILRGASLDLRSTAFALLRALLLSAGLVFLILAAQFESLRLPWLVLLAVPLSAVGVALGLFITDGGLDAMAGSGFVVLIGVVVNDAILEVDLLRRAGVSRPALLRTLLTTSRRRYRPILMTTATTVLGLLPMYLGAGAELRAPLATVVIGGLVSATFLTLLFVPTVFLLVEGRRAMR